ncbi:sorbosone dehydrogenase, partial [Sinorhizobium medicae]
MTVLVRPKALGEYKVREFRMLIDGQWVDSAEGRTIERVAPGHGVAVSRYQAATKVDAERAIAAARRAFDQGPWPRMTAAERSLILLKVADMVAARADELAFLDAVESGKPISQAKGELAGAADIWRYAA